MVQEGCINKACVSVGSAGRLLKVREGLKGSLGCLLRVRPTRQGCAKVAETREVT
jgi:hypothetical protein